MTKQTITSYTAFLCVVVVMAMAGIMTVHASEVTGTLSSDTTSDSQTGGDLGGSVSSDSQTGGQLAGTVSGGSGGSSSGSSGGSSGGGESISLSSSGSVLGASTDNPQAPGFPNTGTGPSEEITSTPWSVLKIFLKNVISF